MLDLVRRLLAPLVPMRSATEDNMAAPGMTAPLVDISGLEARIAALDAKASLLHAGFAGLTLDVLRVADPRHADRRSLARARGQVYSQNQEDGIIAEIFARIGTESLVFVEIGVGTGLENNTRLLLETGWTGLWFEGDPNSVAAIRSGCAHAIAEGRLALEPGMVTRESALAPAERFLAGRPLDLLSIDIDYNTSHVFAALAARLSPRVAVIEYNAHFPPSVDFEVPYDAQSAWENSVRFGASLKALERIARDAGMCLVGCDLHGVNAFFVREDLCSEALFAGPFTAERHYEPPRFELVQMRGHPRHDGRLA